MHSDQVPSKFSISRNFYPFPQKLLRILMRELPTPRDESLTQPNPEIPKIIHPRIPTLLLTHVIPVHLPDVFTVPIVLIAQIETVGVLFDFC